MTAAELPDDERIRSVLYALFGDAGQFNLEAVPSHCHLCRKASRGDDAFLVKIAVGGPHTEEELLRGAQWQRLAEAQGAEVAELFAADAAPNELGHAYLIQRWVPGQAAGAATALMKSAELANLARSLGHNIALIHSAVPRAHRPVGMSALQLDNWRSQCVDRLATRLRVSKEAGNVAVDLPNAIAERCAGLLDNGVHDAAFGLIHWDLHAGNIIVQGERVAAVLDFDRANVGDPLVDFVKLDASLFSRRPDSFAPFMEAYAAVLPCAPSWSQRVYLYQGIEYLSAISLVHHFPDEVQHYHELIRRWLANDRGRWDGPTAVQSV